MSRKIEDAMIQAINAHRNWRSGNTQVQAMCDGTVMVFLHGHQIAQMTTKSAHWTLAGWNTPTTRSRINALAREFEWHGVNVKAGVAYSNGKVISITEWVNAS